MKTLIKTITLAACGLLVLAGPTLSADVTVNLNTTFQTIDGFGGHQDRGWTGYNQLAADRNLAYGNGPGQLGFTIMRFRIYESSGSWGQDLVDAKDIASRPGMKLFATAWSPPTTMRVASGSSYKVDPSKYQAYVDHLNAFAKHFKDNGAPLYAMSFQNEPDWCGEWACGTTTEMVSFAKNWGAKLRVNGNKVITAESFSFNKGYYDGLLNDAAGLANVDILGTHFYGTSKTTADATFDYTLFKQKGGKTPFWMTEVYTADVNNQGSNTWPLCLDVAYEMHRALALSNMSAYVWWYLKRNYGPLWIATNSAQGAATAGTISKVGRMMGHYSKYVRPGAVRVDATRKVQTDVYTSAFKKNDSIVIVSVNRATSAKTVTFAVAGMKSTTGKKITTSGTKDWADDGNVAVSDGNFSVTFEAQSVSTLVFTGNGNTSIESIKHPTPAAGEYEIYGASGALVGNVTLSQGQVLETQVGALSPKSGLYFAKPKGALGQSIPVAVP